MQFVQGGKSGHANVKNPGHAKFVVSGPLAAVEAADAAVWAGTVASRGPLASTEVADTAAFAGSTTGLATLAVTEAADAAAFAGTTAAVGAAGILAATEADDNAVVSGGIAGAGVLAATEAADTVALAGSPSSAGMMAAIEAADTFAAAGATVDIGSAFGSLAATEAADSADATGEVTGEVVAPPVLVGGGVTHAPPRPYPIEGYGYGVLPRLEGEAHGVVANGATARGILPDLTGELVGSTGAAGNSAAQLAVRAAGCGNSGELGTAVARLKGLKAAGNGDATADDERDAVMALLLAA